MVDKVTYPKPNRCVADGVEESRFIFHWFLRVNTILDKYSPHSTVEHVVVAEGRGVKDVVLAHPLHLELRPLREGLAGSSEDRASRYRDRKRVACGAMVRRRDREQRLVATLVRLCREEGVNGGPALARGVGDRSGLCCVDLSGQSRGGGAGARSLGARETLARCRGSLEGTVGARRSLAGLISHS